MKKQSSITLFTIIAFAAALLSLSCGGAATNTAKSNAVNNNVAPSNTDEITEASIDEICSDNTSQKPGKIKEKLKDEIKGDKKLNYQHESCESGCSHEKFFLDPVMETNGDVTLYIWGSIYIKDPNDDLDNLHKKYKKFLKRGCVTKVVYAPPPGVSPALLRHFQYTALCEAPNQICADGSCREVCDLMHGNVNTSTNSNSNK